ncbi:MAG: 30S ribosomal protein S8 [Phycisphaerae bacterium]|nr:30S ribosomal protein S8 [Phycisphaerae bacterium]MCZ2401344.1 30S ribosomal protein S8 [Phycisphaerae bacterium]NUQ48712.1 30S ribosomal protein S8 [Phycisphaerae bacterium]
MAITDPIADMLTRIRNANRTGKPRVNVKRSKICLGVAKVLKEEGYVLDFATVEDASGQGEIRIDLKYGDRGEKVIQDLQRVSRPGGRVYRRVDELPKVLDGLGISIVSTSRGVLSDRQARKLSVGGEVLCEVW